MLTTRSRGHFSDARITKNLALMLASNHAVSVAGIEFGIDNIIVIFFFCLSCAPKNNSKISHECW